MNVFKRVFLDETWLTATFFLLMLFTASALRDYLPRTKYPDATGVYPPRFWVQKKFWTQDVNIIIGGTSRVYRGVSPEELQKEISGTPSILNFGFSATQLGPAMYRELESRLTDNPDELRMVILGLGPGEMGDYHDVFLQIKKRSRFILTLEEYSDWHFEPLATPLLPLVSETTLHYHEDYKPDGWIASSLEPPRPDRYLKRIKAKYGSFNPDRRRELLDQKQKLWGQIAEWKQKGILVVGFRVPTAYDEYYDLASKFDEEVFGQQFREAGGYWFEFDRDGLFWYDGSHLREDHARRLSRALGKFIETEVLTPTHINTRQ